MESAADTYEWINLSTHPVHLALRTVDFCLIPTDLSTQLRAMRIAPFFRLSQANFARCFFCNRQASISISTALLTVALVLHRMKPEFARAFHRK